MPLIHCEVSLILTWSANCFIVAGILAKQVPTFAISDTKRYLLVVLLSTQDHAKLLQQLKSGKTWFAGINLLE